MENSPRTPKTQNGGQAIKRPANANGTPTDEFRQPLRKKNPADADNGVKALAAGITQINFITPYMNRLG
jgi:hypothetical protein